MNMMFLLNCKCLFIDNPSFVLGKSILNMTEEMGNNMDFQDESVNVTAPSLAVSMINVNPDDFKGLTFGVSSISSNLNPQVRQYERYDLWLKRSAIVRYPRAEEKKPSLKLLLDSS